MGIVTFASKVKLDFAKIKKRLEKKQVEELEKEHGIKLQKVKKPNGKA